MLGDVGAAGEGGDAGVIPTDTRAFVSWGDVSEARGAPGVEIIIQEV